MQLLFALTLAAGVQAIFECPIGIIGSYASNLEAETFGLRFCSNTTRWSPNDLIRTIRFNNTQYVPVAGDCSRLCGVGCTAFSVAPTAVGSGDFNCNIYNRTTLFNATTSGGLFYARQGRTQLQINCPTPVPLPSPIPQPQPQPQPIPIVPVFPVQYVTEVIVIIGCNGFCRETITTTRTVTTSQTVTSTVTSTSTTSGTISSTSSGPTPNPTVLSALCGSQFPPNLFDGSTIAFSFSFCSGTERWAASTLIGSTQIVAANSAEAVEVCRPFCGSDCLAFSVSYVSVNGGSSWNCNRYNVAQRAAGVTNGGLFYARQNIVSSSSTSETITTSATSTTSESTTVEPTTTPTPNPTALAALCDPAPPVVAGFENPASCSGQSRYTPGNQIGAATTIAGTSSAAATQCGSLCLPNAACLAYSVTYTNLAGGDSFQCALFTSAATITEPTFGGLLYVKTPPANINAANSANAGSNTENTSNQPAPAEPPAADPPVESPAADPPAVETPPASGNTDTNNGDTQQPDAPVAENPASPETDGTNTPPAAAAN